MKDCYRKIIYAKVWSKKVAVCYFPIENIGK